MENIKWLIGLMDKKYRKWHVLALCISAFTSLMLLINPTLTSIMVDRVFPMGKDAPPPQFDLLVPLLLLILGVRVLREGLRYLMIVIVEKSSQNVIYNLRIRLFTRLQYQDTRFFDRNRTGDLMTRMSADTDWCRHFLSYIDFQAIDSVVMFLSTSIYLFVVNWQLALALVLVTPILMVITKIYSKGVRKLFMAMRERQSEMNAAAQENIAANRVIKAFAREEHEKEAFDAKSNAFREAHLAINKRWLTFFPFIEILANAMTLITLFFGGFLLIQTINGSTFWAPLSLGQLQIFTSLSWALSVPMRQLGNLLNDWQRFLTCSNKVMELEMSKSDIVDAPDAVDHERVEGGVEFRHVSFAHDNTPVLKDVSFKVEPGKTLAIMGPTGSGKTTIIQLLARCYEVREGDILVDGCSVKRWKLNQLRDGIGTATQDVFLFSDTVEGNIAFGDQDLTEEQVHDFARRAAAGDFIEGLSEGYDTIVGERGVGLSGGQKQRIALARALAVQPGILVMDDTTSAVDMETEQYIQQQLRELPYDCTKIIIAQRISSVKEADEILVLKDGEISERGTHEELLRNRGYYYETFCLQNGIDIDEAPSGKEVE